jgi:two-component system invasion response regulator UvrY
VTIRILLVDDHPIVREGYRRLLAQEPGFIVCAEAETASEAYAAYRKTEPHVVIMDLHLPGVGGIEAIRHIRQWDGNARVLVFTMQLGAAYALKAFEAGASGYVTKSSSPRELIDAVTAVAAGKRMLSEDISRAIAAERLQGSESIVRQLTPRESEILRLIASGTLDEDIARLLHLSPKTVRNHHYAIKSKVGARNDVDLVWIAIEAGLVSR